MRPVRPSRRYEGTAARGPRSCKGWSHSPHRVPAWPAAIAPAADRIASVRALPTRAPAARAHRWPGRPRAPPGPPRSAPVRWRGRAGHDPLDLAHQAQPWPRARPPTGPAVGVRRGHHRAVLTGEKHRQAVGHQDREHALAPWRETAASAAGASLFPCRHRRRGCRTCVSHNGSRGKDSAAPRATAILGHRGGLIAHMAPEVEARKGRRADAS